MHKIKLFPLLFAFCLAICLYALPGVADDWQAIDESFEQKKVERYHQIVDRSAEESYAFVQMMKAVGQGADYEALKQTYVQKVAKSPKSFNLRMILGHIYKYGGNVALALDSYREASKIQENALVYEAIGSAEQESKDLQSAEQSYTKALSMTKDKAQKERILRALATMALHRRQMTQAQDYFAQLVALDPKSVFLRKELSQLYVDNKLYDEALRQLDEAEKLAGGDTQARLQIRLEKGQILELQGKDEEAIALYQAEARKVNSQHWLQREVAHRVVEINRRLGRLDNTLEELTKLWSKPSYDQYLVLADLNDELGHSDTSERLLTQAIALQPKSPEARLKLISSLQAQGKEAQVFKAYDDLIKAVPSNIEYRLTYADMLFKRKKDNDAIRVLTKAQSDFRDDGDALLRVGDKYLEYQKTQQARALYQDRLKRAPQDVDTIEALGALYAMEGRSAEALKTWQGIEKSRLTKAEKREVLGRIYAEHSLYAQAQALYEQSIKDSPNDCESKRNLADLHERSRSYSVALAQWEDISQNCAQLALKREANKRIVAIYKAQGILGTKLQEFEAAYNQNPKDLDKGFFLADAFGQDDDPQGALRVLEAMNKANPNTDEVLFALADAYANLRQFDKVQSSLQQIIANNSPQKREAMLAVADYALQQGEPIVSEHYLLEALKLNANDAPTNAKLAQVYQRLKQEQKAIFYDEAALSIDPRAFDIELHLASLYTMNGEYDKADKHYLHIVLEANDESLIQKAGMRSIDYHEYNNSLETLEKELYPATRKIPRKAVYDLLMLRLCDAQAQSNILALKSGDPQRAAVARYALRDIGQRFSKTIVSALQSSNLVNRNLALTLAPHLSIANALPVLESFLEQDDRMLQIEAMLAIAFSQLPSAIPVLKKYTAPRYDRRIREIATWGLGIIQSPAAYSALSEISELNIDSLRAIAAIGLGRQNQNPELLLRLLQNDPSNSVKLAAAWALGAMRVNSALPQILKLLQTVPNSANVALWASSLIPSTQSTEAILNALWPQQTQVQNLRLLAAKLIRRLDHTPKFNNLSQWENNRSFISSMQNHERGVYLNALDYITLLKAFIDEDLNTLEPSPERFLRTNTDAVLGVMQDIAKSGQNAATLALLQDLSSASPARFDRLAPDNEDLWRKLVEATVDVLPQLMQSNDTSIAYYAVKLGAYTQNAKVLPTLAQIAQGNANPALRSEAIAGLAAFNDGHALLYNLSKDEHYLVRASTMQALGNVVTNKAQDALIQALADPFVYVASIAAKSLAKHKSSSSKTSLIKAFQRNDAQLQIAVLDALKAIGANDEIKKLHSDDAQVMAKINSLLNP